ncbi:MAG: DUF58 domain-containing protein [Firmicutes bacterium]|nr:DUF58 domain-containing protein [Bacillota bacterium]
MIKMKLSWLALEILFTGCFLYFGSSTALALAAAMVLIPLVLLLANLCVRGKIHTAISADLNIRKGDSGNITISLENRAALPVLRMQCRVRVENQLNREVQVFAAGTWLMPKGKQQLILQTGSRYCGRLKITLEKVNLFDCFGLLGIPCGRQTAAYMTVQPETFETDITLLPNTGTNEESDIYSQEKPGSDLTEVFQIREYVPGDHPKQVHWKLSNKLDRLIVRDPGLPIIRNVLVFWERGGESGDLELIDAQAEIVVSLCRSLLEHSIQFTIGWNDTDRNLCILHEIQNMDELVGIVPRLLRATGAKDAVSGPELLLQEGSHALCGHMVYLAEKAGAGAEALCDYGHVTMILGDETTMPGSVAFDAEHYREQLAHLAL